MGSHDPGPIRFLDMESHDIDQLGFSVCDHLTQHDTFVCVQ